MNGAVGVSGYICPLVDLNCKSRSIHCGSHISPHRGCGTSLTGSYFWSTIALSGLHDRRVWRGPNRPVQDCGRRLRWSIAGRHFTPSRLWSLGHGYSSCGVGSVAPNTGLGGFIDCFHSVSVRRYSILDRYSGETIDTSSIAARSLHY